MSYVGLDIATETGVAVWYSGDTRPRLSTLRLPSDPEEVARPMEKLRATLADVHAVDPIEALFFEAAILPHPKIKEGRAVLQTNIMTVYKLCALAGMAEWFAKRIEAKCRQVEQQRWRKHFTGKGTGPTKEMKELAKEACRIRGWRVANDHEADAAGVLDFGLSCLGVAVPWRDDHLFKVAGEMLR